MASHVTKSTVRDLGAPLGEPRFVGVCECSCSWTWESKARVDWRRALMVAELAGTAHRVFESIDAI